LSKNVLVTGGAGFIGSHLVEVLIQRGFAVRVLDNLERQVHGDLAERGAWPAYCNPEAEYLLGDVRDAALLEKALQNIQIVYHFAAATGVGQSMYQIAKYSAVNIQGTANLLDLLATHPHQVEKIILSSSRAVYGEGLYRCQVHGEVSPTVRAASVLNSKAWEITCPLCGSPLTPLPTPESKSPAPGSIYAVSKQSQEQLVQCFGAAYQIPVVILRFFNVYGPRQSLRNPYTGILSTFIQRLFNQLPPQVYEDGKMSRDFVHVDDVVNACQLALKLPQSGLFNIGSGEFTTILELAQTMCELLHLGQPPEVIGVARVGDIRHCSASLIHASEVLGYSPSVALKDGLAEVIDHAKHESAKLTLSDRSSIARDELKQSGLLK
jgi:dTDP-L-rhamnose 4-epimerase